MSDVTRRIARWEVKCTPERTKATLDAIRENMWGAPGLLDTWKGESSMRPEVTNGVSKDATQDLYA